MSYQVKNWTMRDTLQIGARCYENHPLVGLICGEGSMRFQHDLTPEQARSMSKFLIASALESEMMLEGVEA